jgi:hypothetical protein
MRITNHTKWNTADLRKVILAVLNQWNARETRKVSKTRLRVTVTYNRSAGRYTTGHAWLNSATMRLYVGKNEVDVLGLANTAEHEIAHCAGYDHDHMHGYLARAWHPTDDKRRAESAARYPFLAGVAIRPKAVKPAKPKPDAQVVAYDRVIAGIARWQTKAKRAATALKKLNQRKRYYEKALAAKRAVKEKPDVDQGS